ncbi:MAG: molybdopterin synthase sulfur carrier subunit [Bacteroidia bacterium]|nr:MAG: molybdopterin synthase sulfur carrier subunit [Bacteroidia bacterium]
MKIRLRLFANARDLAGFAEKTVDLQHPRASEVFEYLASVNPEFREWSRSIRLAVNRRYVDDAHPLQEGDEVAVIPPVSGG